jgi:hypothetical protein
MPRRLPARLRQLEAKSVGDGDAAMVQKMLEGNS